MSPSPSRMTPADVLRAGTAGLLGRKLRAALSALGIAIGIASMVAVLGISESSRADLLSALDSLGTNLLTAAPGQTFDGEDAELPETATAAAGGMAGVQRAAAVKALAETVRRTDRIPEAETGGIAVTAADIGLLPTLGARLRSGRFLDAAAARQPAVVLGAEAARTLGISRPGTIVFLGDRWFTVIGVLRRVALDSALDRAALIGFPVAARLFDAGREPTKVYVRADPAAIPAVRELLGPTANPDSPEEVEVSRPSDALAARAAAKTAFTSLLLGLGAVALLVGGVGIANVMVISVLERRSEIGLRRALGATERHITAQFLSESLIIAALGGFAGTALGALVTTAYALARGWELAIPPVALAGGLAAALGIGAVAGLYPAWRAARLSPSEALRAV